METLCSGFLKSILSIFDFIKIINHVFLIVLLSFSTMIMRKTQEKRNLLLLVNVKF